MTCVYTVEHVWNDFGGCQVRPVFIRLYNCFKLWVFSLSYYGAMTVMKQITLQQHHLSKMNYLCMSQQGRHRHVLNLSVALIPKTNQGSLEDWHESKEKVTQRRVESAYVSSAETKASRALATSKVRAWYMPIMLAA